MKLANAVAAAGLIPVGMITYGYLNKKRGWYVVGGIWAAANVLFYLSASDADDVKATNILGYANTVLGKAQNPQNGNGGTGPGLGGTMSLVRPGSLPNSGVPLGAQA